MIKDIPDWKFAIDEAKKETFNREPTNFQEVCKILGKAMELLLISKNHKYGKGNILKATEYGMTPQQGAMLRENDKTERIKNGFRGINLGKEGFVESYGDKIGYSAICLMLEYGWYELPIQDQEK